MCTFPMFSVIFINVCQLRLKRMLKSKDISFLCPLTNRAREREITMTSSGLLFDYLFTQLRQI